MNWLSRMEHGRDIEAGTESDMSLEDMSLDDLLDALLAEARANAKAGRRESDEERAIYEHIVGRY